MNAARNPATHPSRRSKHARLALTSALIAGALSASAAAQERKQLRGAVHDPLGALVVSASVDLLQGDRVIATTRTGPHGTFHFDIPASARYSVRVSAPTFETTTTAALYTNGSGNDEIDVTLATQTLTQQVTVTATGTATPEAQIGASVTVLPAEDFQFMTEVQQPLRLIPGLQVTQVGQMGGSTGLRIRGANTDANKVLIDGVPADQIGGLVEFANITTVGIDSVEVLREPNSALYGSDALAGVVSLTSARGTTRLPFLTYAGDAGNFGTYRNEVTAGTVYKQFDLYSAFARIDTRNNLPNSLFHNATYAGNFGWTPDTENDLRFTVRHLAVSGGQPNAIALYGIPDDAQQKEQDDFYNAVWNNQTTPRWHNQLRYGGLRLNAQYKSFGATGIPDGFGDYDGALVTITGANGYTVSGQAAFQFSDQPTTYLTSTNRDFVYAQSDFQINPHLLALGAFKYENESGAAGYTGSTPTSIQRGNYSYTAQFSGDVHNRLFYNLGTGLEDNGLFGFAATPRASLAYYLVRPSASGVLAGTKLHGSFGKGIKEPSLFQQTESLYGTLATLPNGSALIAQYGVTPIGPEDSRTYDGGVDQQLFNGRVRLNFTYFHNEFTNGLEYVPQSALVELGVPAANVSAFAYGAYINSESFRSQGLEFESEYKIGQHLFARSGYTYTDAVVQHSFSSDNLAPVYNTSFNFPTIQIGAYSPLVGARPFRVAPHTGYFGLDYTRSRFFATLTGSLVGKRDDSTYLSDSNFGNSLLLPNRNLLGSYQRLALGAGYQVTPRLNIYSNIENLTSEHYYEAFGYPSLPLTFRSGIKLNFGGESWSLK